MKTYRATIVDIAYYKRPTVEEMIVTEMTHIGGDIMRFRHPDNTVTVINIKPGWKVTVEPTEAEGGK